MQVDSDPQRRFAIRYLKGCGWFIVLCGVGGLLMYFFDVAETQKYPYIAVLGSAFCAFGARQMFRYARRLQDHNE